MLKQLLSSHELLIASRAMCVCDGGLANMGTRRPVSGASGNVDLE